MALIVFIYPSPPVVQFTVSKIQGLQRGREGGVAEYNLDRRGCNNMQHGGFTIMICLCCSHAVVVQFREVS